MPDLQPHTKKKRCEQNAVHTETHTSRGKQFRNISKQRLALSLTMWRIMGDGLKFRFDICQTTFWRMQKFEQINKIRREKGRKVLNCARFFVNNIQD